MPKEYYQHPGGKKQCRECKQTKKVGEFSKETSAFDGLKGKCKQCVRDYNKEYRAQNLEAERQRGRYKQKTDTSWRDRRRKKKD